MANRKRLVFAVAKPETALENMPPMHVDAVGGCNGEQPDIDGNIIVGQENVPRSLKVRLDMWLWAARFFKTRALARLAIEKGLVLYRGEVVKPGIEIQTEEVISIKEYRHNRSFWRSVTIKGLSTRRRDARDSCSLYETMYEYAEG
jgi:ribosomal 50S subunit-recycling heat shock protein